MEIKNYFGDIKYNGEVFSFPHLNPIYIEFYGQQIKRKIKLKVLYTDHCFTARIDRTVRDSQRIFSLERYNLSKLLPSIIKAMNNDKTKVFQTLARRNFAYVVATKLNDKNYNIFFDMKKSNKSNPDCDLVMRIESAYIFDDDLQLEHSGKIKFLILCQKIYKGEKIQCRK